MDADFPAAHSMDTTFFAVDAAGHVAVFFTGETGPAPEGASRESLFALVDQLSGILPEQTNRATIESMHEAGLFCYEANEDEPLPLQPIYERYERYGVPEKTLHVDQLPPRIRKLSKQFPLEDLCFAISEKIQLLEHVDCQVWSEEEAAYLCPDGKTVKPLPGKEEDFASFAEELCRDYPEQTAQLQFEGIAQPRQTKRSRKKKKRDDGE